MRPCLVVVLVALPIAGCSDQRGDEPNNPIGSCDLTLGLYPNLATSRERVGVDAGVNHILWEPHCFHAALDRAPDGRIACRAHVELASTVSCEDLPGGQPALDAAGAPVLGDGMRLCLMSQQLSGPAEEGFVYEPDATCGDGEGRIVMPRMPRGSRYWFVCAVSAFDRWAIGDPCGSGEAEACPDSALGPRVCDPNRNRCAPACETDDDCTDFHDAVCSPGDPSSCVVATCE